MKSLIAQMEERQIQRDRERMKRLKKMRCYKCVWSTYLENKLYCPFGRCINHATKGT